MIETEEELIGIWGTGREDVGEGKEERREGKLWSRY